MSAVYACSHGRPLHSCTVPCCRESCQHAHLHHDNGKSPCMGYVYDTDIAMPCLCPGYVSAGDEVP